MGYKEKVLKLFADYVDREGSDKLVKVMKKTDFFVAPASRSHHLNYEGGLVEHSYNVYSNYVDLVEKYNLDIPMESIVLEAIGHDFCKIGLYKKEKTEWSDKQASYLKSLVQSNAALVAECDVDVKFDENGELIPVSREYASDLISWLSSNPNKDNCPDSKDVVSYVYNDDFPAGHGEKSIFILQRFIRLKKRELLAIRWHMGAFEDGIYGGFKNRDFNRAREMFPDVSVLQMADAESSFKEDWV
jgi:hypothetical protein